MAVKKNAHLIMGIDSAYKNSELVVVCTPLFIDSAVHQQKASFYLVGIKVDSILKGNAHISDGIYFIDAKLPAFKPGGSSWVVYLSRRKMENYWCTIIMFGNGQTMRLFRIACHYPANAFLQ